MTVGEGVGVDGDESGDGAGDEEREHLSGVEDGAGCTEIWEHLSERRDEE